jgi:hypothetical protein
LVVGWKTYRTGTCRVQDTGVTPLPIWRTEDGSESICIGSVEELQAEAEKAVKAGVLWIKIH